MPLAALRDALTAAQNVAGQVMALYDYLEAVEYRRSLTELAALREQTEQELAQAEERWLYLTDLAERIEAQKKS